MTTDGNLTSWSNSAAGGVAGDPLLARARLLVRQNQYEEAADLLRQLEARWPVDLPELVSLRACIEEWRERKLDAAARRRELRQTFMLNTSFRRWVAVLGMAALTFYGAWQIGWSLHLAKQHGWDHPVTTRFQGRRGVTTWTRPVSTDLQTGATAVVLGAAALVVIRLFTRDAEDWEELDGPVISGDTRTLSWWW